jgi:hypothetical protein
MAHFESIVDSSAAPSLLGRANSATWREHTDARYLGAQADLCLEMARQVSDRATADNLRAEAARYHAAAAEIETGVKMPVIKAAPEQN